TRIERQSGYDLSRTYAGTIDYRRFSQPGFEVQGSVSAVLVDRGDRVTAGMLLVQLDPSSVLAQVDQARAIVASAEAELKAQAAQLELSRATLLRYENLVSRGFAADQQLDEYRMAVKVELSRAGVMRAAWDRARAELKLAEVALARTTITAPFDGVVTDRYLDEGSIVSPGQAVLGIAENAFFEARIGMPASIASTLRHDTTYEFRSGSKRLSGSLKSLLPGIDSSTASISAVFALDSNDLYAGSLAEILLTVHVEEPGFWIPIEALTESQRGLWSVLAVVEEETGHEVQSRLVEILHRGQNQVFVRGTLRDGEYIVASATSRIVPGQRIALAGNPQ
ncbi:MAG: efflux RND transporter periplasmic adaptor subunit, partial [Proteobacteria bacterium]|nr:efflux RND transporter periplasmic adaptor subunit [Pseudomonadota bacterium]